ncbi:hypothetical protein SAMN04488115_10835 [Bosea lathyri]|uniref:Uncharacterized protein n=1 Tax=Bosea lathyri TaxID=1036778 RepID=A0A1H6BTQ0_9HYPH|nr:hypothetical protein SAMN04488115_10835 [Bosea lathyri]
MALKAISRAMTRSEESIGDRAKQDGIGTPSLADLAKRTEPT